VIGYKVAQRVLGTGSFSFPDCNRKIKIISFRVSFTLFILRHIIISQFKGKILAVNKRNIRENYSSLTSRVCLPLIGLDRIFPWRSSSIVLSMGR
jgi:hypothetical protein